jgi:hypothetical protein
MLWYNMVTILLKIIKGRVYMFFDYVRANRNRVISIGIIMIALGLILGLSYSTIVSPILTVIGYILLFGIFPLGALFSMYGYYIKFYKNPKLLLAKIVVFVAISDILFYLGTLVVQYKYFSVAYDVIYGFVLIKAMRLIGTEEKK